MLNQELISEIEKTFGFKNKIKKQTPYRVKFNGQFIITSSNKTVWNGIGPAKAAIINHLQCWASELGVGYYKCKELKDELEKQGIIEYVALSEEK